GRIPAFLAKAFDIFSNPEFENECGWSPNGESIIIKDAHNFAQRVLPKYFKHGNVQSFTRQLNMYDFRKVVNDPTDGEFTHALFKRGQRHLLPFIKRKV
ncbi:unnamed protein product, partial [Phaeothamnion confervicola]